MAVLAAVSGRAVRVIGLVLLVSMLLAMLSPSACAARSDDRRLSGEEASNTYRLVAGTLSTDTCATDFSTVSFANVKSACDANSSPSAACCEAFTNTACLYSSEVNDFNSICPILFIDYLNAAGPYPAGYFVGSCVSGYNGLCTRT